MGSVPAVTAALAAALAAVCAAARFAPPAAAQPMSTGGAGGTERMTATVRAVDLEHHRLDLLTGVGYALRIQRVEVPAELAVLDRGTRASLSAVTAGCIVRVGCHHSMAGMVASTLDLLERPAPGVKP